MNLNILNQFNIEWILKQKQYVLNQTNNKKLKSKIQHTINRVIIIIIKIIKMKENK